MDDGAEVAHGEIGELELRNPATMLGYYGMPDETAEVLVDGWLRTGDLVRRNEDETFTFISRKKEVIRRRGENLAPSEVEDALVAQPGHPRSRGHRGAGGPRRGRREGVRASSRPGPTLDLDALRDRARDPC